MICVLVLFSAKTEQQNQNQDHMNFENMDEDEYDALPEHEKEMIEKKILSARKRKRDK